MKPFEELTDEEYTELQKSNETLEALVEAKKAVSKPNYYAILPAKIRYDKSLSYLEKILYGEITAMSGKFGYCFATNEYFAKNFNSSERTISRSVAHLAELGYISIQSEHNGGRDGTLRKLFINFNKMGELVTGGEVKVEVDKNVQERWTKMSRSNEEKPSKEGVDSGDSKGSDTGNSMKDNNTSILYNTPGKATPAKTEIPPLPLSFGRQAAHRLITLYEVMWKYKFGVACKKIAVGTSDSGIIRKLLVSHSEAYAALIIITHFDWHGANGNDENIHRRLENAGYPLSWLSAQSQLYLAFIKNHLGIETEEEAVKRVQEAITTITKKQ